ncbi:hypothetical protein IVB38_02615 [Bradyrhizobium sp. 38]|jgi:hypothetical protein|uniref:hypothetical protein n=1 Tax=unclassified Bradyrhizobium TaxID=2631580 RepID=UPI001FFAE313|nr:MULTISPECIES: hypothetical protein [unclassified Bradyrhizobium]MCK1334956.1 hypothetical protein [Bradyrhizobium sp. 38]MCK1779023.1 hypothetical protein [Bradyrhizobium sp. 132]
MALTHNGRERISFEAVGESRQIRLYSRSTALNVPSFWVTVKNTFGSIMRMPTVTVTVTVLPLTSKRPISLMARSRLARAIHREKSCRVRGRASGKLSPQDESAMYRRLRTTPGKPATYFDKVRIIPHFIN